MSKFNFIDANGKVMTKSQAFKRYTSTFLLQSRYIKYVVDADEKLTGKTKIQLIYRAFLRPEGQEGKVLGQKWFEQARKEKREIETIITVKDEWSTVADIIDYLLQDLDVPEKMTVKQQMLDAHATQAATYIDEQIFKAWIALKTDENTTQFKVVDPEYLTKDEANEFAKKFLRQTKKELNKFTKSEVNRNLGEGRVLLSSIIYDALALSDYYKPYATAAADEGARTGRMIGEKFRGLEIIESPEMDPVNSGYYPSIKNVGAFFEVDTLGGTVLQETNEDKVWGANVHGFNVRVIANFGPNKPKDSLRIHFFEFSTTGTAAPSGNVDSIDVTIADDDTGTITANAIVNDATNGKAKLVDGKNATIGTAIDLVNGTEKEVSFSSVPAEKDYKIIVFDDNNANIYSTDNIFVTKSKELEEDNTETETEDNTEDKK